MTTSLGNPINPNVSGDTPALPASGYTSGTVSVSDTSATLIATIPRGFVGGVLVTNTGSDTVYLGGPSVSATNGFPLAAGATVAVPGSPGVYGASLYGLAVTAAVDVAYLMPVA